MSGVQSSALLPLHPDILASLFTPEGQPYLQEVTVLTGFTVESAFGVKLTSLLHPCRCDAPAGDVRHA